MTLLILKFGGSVLTNGGAIPSVVQEISRHLSSCDRVIVVVSAFRNQTDALERTALALCPSPGADVLAFYMGLGEMRAAGELTLGLQGAGIDATLRMQCPSRCPNTRFSTRSRNARWWSSPGTSAAVTTDGPTSLVAADLISRRFSCPRS
jgi:hypothetical protein